MKTFDLIFFLFMVFWGSLAVSDYYSSKQKENIEYQAYLDGKPAAVESYTTKLQKKQESIKAYEQSITPVREAFHTPQSVVFTLVFFIFISFLFYKLLASKLL